MNHREALASKASDRYLLGEMGGTEREQFEEHYFSCADCAEDVRAGSALAREVKSIHAEEAESRKPIAPDEPRRSSWFDWWSPAALIPAGAALAMAALVVYQNLVVIPGLRQGSTAAVAATILKSAARGDDLASIEAAAGPVSALSMDINGAEPGGPLLYLLMAPDGTTRRSGTVPAPQPGQPLVLIVQNSELSPPGTWAVVVRTSSGAELGRYPFLLKLK